MSNILDQILMEDIAKHCPQNFINFHQCISQNHTDPSICNKQQFELSQCIKNNVPSLQLILKECDAKLNDYSKCIMGSKNGEGCEPQLKEVRDCATQFVGADSGKLNKL